MATSSAEPEKLFRYSDVTLALDSEVKSESARLAGSLGHFESACREPGFRVSVGHLASFLSSHGGECETIDSWVRRVGAGFLAADSGGFGASLLQIRRWHPWRLPLGVVVWVPSLKLRPVVPSWLSDAVKAPPWVGSRPIPVPAPTPEPSQSEFTPTPEAILAHAGRPKAIEGLVDVKPENYSETIGCVLYAQNRRPDLGSAGGDGGARNYIVNHRDHIVQLADEDKGLQDKVAKGYALVWDAGHPGLKGTEGETYGHVAIVEEVGPDYVIVSQAGVPKASMNKRIDRAALESLYIIGPTQ